MKAKEYLEQIARSDAIINNLINDKEIIRDTMCSMSSNTQKERVQCSREDDKLSTLYAKLEAKEEEVVEKIDKLVDFKLKVSKEINQLQDRQHIRVLYEKYILMKDWKEIADELDCTLRHAQRVHGNALIAFAKVHSDMLNGVKCHKKSQNVT